MSRLALFAVLLSLSACNTFEGAGEDISAGYHGAKRSAERSQARNEARTPGDWERDTPRAQSGRLDR